ncbi:MAG TPA: alpha/beta fold hydrolase [Solirubrobacteraceae bacterium]|nr:alpha/beta fold hydrolase [Solirubrobacteraceae bacterium]
MSGTVPVPVEVAGGELEVLDLPGDPDRSPVILLHEGLGSIELWRHFPVALQQATQRRLIVYSRHGHGRSAPPAQPRTPAFFEDEARRVLPALGERLGVRSPILLGHSDGASIALIHAAHHPVDGLVLLAPHVFVEEVTVRAIAETRETYLRGDLRERLGRYHDDPDAAFWGWCDVWLDPAFRGWDLEADVARVTAPTLLIQGADDPYGSLEQLDRIQVRVPEARRLVLPGGHSPHLEHGAAVVEAVAGFVAGL